MIYNGALQLNDLLVMQNGYLVTICHQGEGVLVSY